MSKFYVGQRVRKIAHSPKSDMNVPIGGTGVVVGFGRTKLIKDVIWPWVVYDGYSEVRATHEKCLEPIEDDDSRQVTTWSQCLWQPKQVRA